MFALPFTYGRFIGVCLVDATFSQSLLVENDFRWVVSKLMNSLINRYRSTGYFLVNSEYKTWKHNDLLIPIAIPLTMLIFFLITMWVNTVTHSGNPCPCRWNVIRCNQTRCFGRWEASRSHDKVSIRVRWRWCRATSSSSVVSLNESGNTGFPWLHLFSRTPVFNYKQWLFCIRKMKQPFIIGDPGF